MVFHHGDRVITVNKNTKKLDFGRIHHFNNDEYYSSPSPPRSKLTRLGDYLNTSEYKNSSGFSLHPSPVKSPKNTKGIGEKDRKVNCFIVWDNGKGEIELQRGVKNDNPEQIYRVFDRKFSPGQRVIRKGQRGKVIDVIPLITLQVIQPEHSKYFILPDVEVDKIKPVSDLFNGVSIIYNNHIGQIQDVQRRTTYIQADGTRLIRTSMDSELVNDSKFQPQRIGPPKSTRTVSKLFTYPFSSSPYTGAPYPRKLVKLARATLQKMKSEMENDKENQSEPLQTEKGGGISSFVNKLTRKKPTDLIEIGIEDSEIICMKVKWIGQLPSHLVKSHQGLSLPPKTLNAEQVKEVIPLHIPTSTYLDKPTGVGSCTTEITPMSELEWASETYRSVSSAPLPPSQKFDLSRITFGKPEARKKDLEIVQKVPRDYIATKHCVRHKYEVVWDPKNGKSYFGAEQETGIYFGNELEPDTTQEHKLCLGQIHSHLYVVPKKSEWMDGKFDYGIVIEKLDSESVVVEWLKVEESNGSVKNNSILKCSLMNIDKHPVFNDFHEGRIVVRSKAAGKWMACKGFKIGTVKSVKRFSMGQIVVHCPLTNKTLEFWPHMLDLFVGFSMKELIEQKQVGVNRNKLCLKEMNLLRNEKS